MLISEKVVSALNLQIGNEFGASHQYVAIAAHFDVEGLPELSSHFYRQAEEERQHAMRFVKYIIDAGGRPAIPPIPAPTPKFQFAEEAVKLSLEQEIKVTQQINGLYDLAQKEGDHITLNFLQWFLKEQLEEVSSMDTLLKIVQRAGEAGLLHVEQYLARKKKGGATKMDFADES
jgi:ferritin